MNVDARLPDAQPTSDQAHSEIPTYRPDATGLDKSSDDRTLTHIVLPSAEPHTVRELPENLREHPRYRVLRRLGAGGMGEVFLAEHRLMGRRVALKTIKLGFANTPAIADRFLREIRATAELSHPNIVVAHDAEAAPDHLFLIMEYLDGRDLRTVASNPGGLNPKMACSFVYQAALALNHAHRRGVIHRDIKPGNMILIQDESGGSDGLIKVLDFGLAKVLGETFPFHAGTPAGFAMGTVGFMSPEQSNDARAVGIHADIFSLGRTLYFLLSGRNPYPNGVQSQLAEDSGQDPVIPIEEFLPGVPIEVRRVMQKMSARRSENRYQSCAEVLTALYPLCHTGRFEQVSKRRWWQVW